MLPFFFIVLGVPLVAACVAFVLLKGINWKELTCIGLTNLLIAGVSVWIVSCSSTRDTEILNGTVTGKQQDTVMCSHSYPCNCRESCTGSGSSRSCSTTCDTCYRHMNDYDWVVLSSVGAVVIDRIDEQGVDEPPRWTAVVMGEPVSLSHAYKNYVKAAPGSLFRHQGLAERYAGALPEYPIEVYDYFHVDRFVTDNKTRVDHAPWNEGLRFANSRLGPLKQVNMVVVMAQDRPIDWFSALEESWIGGKKNDVVLVVSTDSDMRPQWASVMAWTTNEAFKVRLRDDVMALPLITPHETLDVLERDVKELYARKPMADFEYLSSQITPSTLGWVLTLVIALVVTTVLIVVFQIHDPFDRPSYGRYRHRPYMSI